MAMQLILRIVSGSLGDLNEADMTQLLYWVGAGQTIRVGRSGFGTDMAVRQDHRMSAVHFEVSCDGTTCRVCDLDSQNGTRVNGEKVSSTVLRDGDIIRAGSSTFSVAILGEESTGDDAAVADTAAAEQHGIEAMTITGAAATSPEPDAVQHPPASGSELAPEDGDTDLVSVAAETEPSEPIQAIIRIESGPFGDLEMASITQVLNWLGAGQSLTFGRTYKADVVVRQDDRLSSRHFEIACDDRTCRLRDLGSRNGTFVNGEKVEEVVLRHGDKLVAGKSTFGVGILGGPEGFKADAASSEPTPPEIPEDEDIPETSIMAAPVSEPALLEPMQVVLTIVSGPSGSWENPKMSRLLHWFGAGQTLKVGRSPWGSDMLIPDDEKMSTVHFELSCDGRKCRLRDLNSRNGTFVNEQRVTEAVLRDEDQIRAGQTTFRVAVQGGLPVTSTEGEFAAVSPLEIEQSADEDGDGPQFPDLDAVFEGIKAKLRSRR